MQLSLQYLSLRLSPFLFCLILILCSTVPLFTLPDYLYSFQFVYIPIFYYAIYHPKILSSWAVFILSLLADLLTTQIFGVYTFSYMAIFFAANFWRKYFINMTFKVLWGIFGLLALGVELFTYFLIWLFSDTSMTMYPIFVELIVLMLVYPLFISVCAFLDQKVRDNS